MTDHPWDFFFNQKHSTDAAEIDWYWLRWAYAFSFSTCDFTMFGTDRGRRGRGRGGARHSWNNRRLDKHACRASATHDPCGYFGHRQLTLLLVAVRLFGD